MYNYEPANLLISYGISVLSTISVTAIGLWALRRNGTSIDNLFSTTGSHIDRRLMLRLQLTNTLRIRSPGTTAPDHQPLQIEVRLEKVGSALNVSNRCEQRYWLVPNLPNIELRDPHPTLDAEDTE